MMIRNCHIVKNKSLLTAGMYQHLKTIYDYYTDNGIDTDIHNKDDNGSNNVNNDHSNGDIIDIKNENLMEICDLRDLMQTTSKN